LPGAARQAILRAANIIAWEEGGMGGRGRLWLTLGLALGTCGCNQDADRLARVCEKVAAKFDGVTESMRDKVQHGWGAVRGSLDEASLEERVALRLHWDHDLEGATLSIALDGPGVVRLSGEVIDLTQRRRAVGLAQTTRGVEQVLDELHVAEAGEH
jgi:osmotically-inducible protein OsmY